ncbi:MAG TPA: hypothetical protein VL326_35400 [Kofleriaceae bacterium]|jgi:hypothetical protein|nr:hypothetical protein [Kofleriaceae bacterium]
MRLAVACLVLTACGRLSFDPAPADGERAQPSVREIGPLSFTTSSATFVDVPSASLVIPASPGQAWLLFVSGQLASDSFLYNGPEARYLVDGIERGIGGTENVTLGRLGPWQHFYGFTGADQPITVTFQLRDAAGGATTLEELRAVAVPLPADADPLFVSNDGPITVTSTVIAPAAQLTLQPSRAGEYLLFLLDNATEAPTASDIDFEWHDPAGAMWSRNLKNPRGSLQSTLLVRRAVLSGPTTVELQAASGGGDSLLEYVRIAAVRIDALGNRLAFAHNANTLQTTGSAGIGTNMLAQTLDPASSYVLFGTAQIDDDCGNSLLAERVADFRVDGVLRDQDVHAAGNCAAENTYGFVDAQVTPPALFESEFSSGNGQNVEHRESTIVILGVP